jgi:hypothetical protein
MEMLIEWIVPCFGAYVWLFRWCRSTDLAFDAFARSLWEFCLRISILFSLGYLWVRFSLWAHLG